MILEKIIWIQIRFFAMIGPGSGLFLTGSETLVEVQSLKSVDPVRENVRMAPVDKLTTRNNLLADN